jgi:16S rRNA (guanine527-N7)-methyltransferase
VQVLQMRAEEVGRDPELRGSQNLVVARSFGPPAVVAECAAPLLRLGGLLVVSEPPSGAEDEGQVSRWPAGPLRELGLEQRGVWEEEFRFQALTLIEACPGRYPRRPGLPAKRPLFV